MNTSSPDQSSVLEQSSKGPDLKLIPMYGAQFIALHLAESSHETNATNRLFKLPRSPANIALMQAMAAGPDMLRALQLVDADVRHHLRSDVIAPSLLRLDALQEVRRMIAKATGGK